MYEFWYQINYDGCPLTGDGGEYFGNTAQECADYIRETYTDRENLVIESIVRVENDWE